MRPTRFAGDSLRSALLDAIRGGEIRPGERLPSFRSLAARYGISLNTVQRVVGELVESRILDADQGRGTFVAAADALAATADFAVGFYGRSEGHFYGDIFGCLRDALLRNGATPIVCTAAQESSPYLRGLRLREMVDGRPRSFVVDGSIATNPALGDTFLATKLFRMANRVRDLVIFHRWENPRRPAGSYFLFDYRNAGYQIARYLHDLGHRRIVLNTFGAPLWPGTYEEDIHAGFLRFMEEHAGGMRIEFFREPQAGVRAFEQERFRALFAGADRPTAVAAVADFQAPPWFERLAAIGLRVPRDVSVTGFYNTPWCEETPVPMTSVQLNIEKLVMGIVNHVVGERDAEEPRRENVLIGASLVLRGSCGPAPERRP